MPSRSKIVLAAAAAACAASGQANDIRHPPESELFESAGLVVDAVITGRRVKVDMSQSRRWRDANGLFHLENAIRKPCLRARIYRHVKGQSADAIVICRRPEAEAAVLPPKGQLVRMYLQQSGTVWTEVLGAGFRAAAR